MELFRNKRIKRLFLSLTACLAGFLLMSQLFLYLSQKTRLLAQAKNPAALAAVFLAILTLLFGGALLALCYSYFCGEERRLKEAVSIILDFLGGDTDKRLDCDEEGELYRLFHTVNTLATVLDAHVQKEQQAKVFLKDTISDISHQLKTPLAALNIYNGILQQETPPHSEASKFASLSEAELDRIEALVQNLLTITKLDAGALLFQKSWEDLSDMAQDVISRFSFRAQNEQKQLLWEGESPILLFCDRNWILEALGNLVKNALDHTAPGDRILVSWQQSADLTQIAVSDNGSGIHPEDLHHVFKRFYRSRFPDSQKQDPASQGIGLGLPLARAIVQAHDGEISVDSHWGSGSVFTVSFLNPSKL